MTPLIASPSTDKPVALPALRLRSQFSLTVPASPDVAVELFGAHGERAWAGEGWNPIFLHPVPAEDRAGAVFLLEEGERRRVGITTLFDRARGQVRHVFVLGDTCVTVIDIGLVPLGPGATRVTVAYERTALRPGAESEVRELASRDAAQGPEWEADIEKALASAARSRRGGGARP